jgi:hypothetical protein
LLPVVVNERAEDCQNNWWTNILYINNYVAVDHMVSTFFIMVKPTIKISKGILGKRALERSRHRWGIILRCISKR